MASARSWALGLAVLPLVACKAKPGTDSPDRDVRSWTIAEIEAELARTDQELAGEGIMIAMATPMVAPPNVPGPAVEEPAAEEPVADEPGTEPEGDDDGSGVSDPPEPTAHPSEPMPTTAPTSVYEGELLGAESPSVDSSVQRREGRQRASSRSRRDTDTRCERVCRLAEATCELETQICELAARHPDEPRYAQACARADQQCEAASQACQRCEE
jgi:hypothetical protein